MTVKSLDPTVPVALTGTQWRLDPDLSAAEFRARTFWGLMTVRGRFTHLDGGIDPSGRMWLVIDVAGLHTGNPRRDRHLNSTDFFDAEHHPQIRFRASGAGVGDGGQVRIVGELRAAGRSVQLELEPAVERRGRRLVIDVTTAIDQRELGMTYRRLGIRVPATVTVHAELEPVAE